MRIDQIHKHLYISALPFQEDLEEIIAQGVTAIVNLAVGEVYTLPDNIVYFHAGFKDNSYVSIEILDEIFTFIGTHIREGRVLVHCNAGISRSGGIIVGQLLLEHPDWSWSDAEKCAQKKRYIMVAPKIKRSVLDYLLEKTGINFEPLPFRQKP